MDPSFIAAGVAALLRLPPSRHDVGEDPSVRQGRVAMVVVAAYVVAHNRREFARLLADAVYETHLARLVFEGHCDRMPKGERCDDGRARGVWQVHPWCKEAYAVAAGSGVSLIEEAHCAVQQMRYGAVRCREHAITPEHGAFAALAQAPCTWQGAERRVRLTARIDAMLSVASRSP